MSLFLGGSGKIYFICRPYVTDTIAGKFQRPNCLRAAFSSTKKKQARRRFKTTKRICGVVQKVLTSTLEVIWRCCLCSELGELKLLEIGNQTGILKLDVKVKEVDIVKFVLQLCICIGRLMALGIRRMTLYPTGSRR